MRRTGYDSLTLTFSSTEMAAYSSDWIFCLYDAQEQLISQHEMENDLEVTLSFPETTQYYLRVAKDRFFNRNQYNFVLTPDANMQGLLVAIVSKPIVPQINYGKASK